MTTENNQKTCRSCKHRQRHHLLWKDKKLQNAERIKKNQGKPNSMRII